MATYLKNVARRVISRESDEQEPDPRRPLSATEVRSHLGPALAFGPPGAHKATIGLHVAGDGAFVLASKDAVVDLEEAR